MGKPDLDVLRTLRRYNEGREPERLALKYAAMAQDPFAFLRGSCHLFYARLSRQRRLAAAPTVWACGDLHLQNFGSYRGDRGLTYFDINDFDEAVLAPAAWELVRLCTSALVAGHQFGLPPNRCSALVDDLLDSYAEALAAGKAQWIERERAAGPVRELLDKVATRDRRHFLDGRTRFDKRGQRHLLVDGRHALPLLPGQREGVERLVARLQRDSATPGFFDLLDVARRVAGTGSLGVRRYVLLVRGKGSPDHNELLDLKESGPSALAPFLPGQPAWKSDAQRVATLQYRLQAVSAAFLRPVKLEGRSFLLRALQPREDRVALEPLIADAAALQQLMRDFGRLAAWAQLRSAGRQGSAGADELVDFGLRSKWRRQWQRASHDAADHVLADAALFRTAWADGAFAPSAR